jgi:hypothetical protein
MSNPFKKAPETPPIVEKVARQLDEMKQPVAKARPFLDQVEGDLQAKYAQIRELETQVSRLEGFKSFLVRHPTVDGLVQYFAEKEAVSRKDP